MEDAYILKRKVINPKKHIKITRSTKLHSQIPSVKVFFKDFVNC